MNNSYQKKIIVFDWELNLLKAVSLNIAKLLILLILSYCQNRIIQMLFIYNICKK
jgi:hypothetical protein